MLTSNLNDFSPVASTWTPSLGYRLGLKQRKRDPIAVVVHSTGAGIQSRFEREGAEKGDRDSFDTAIRVYTKLYKYSGHYVVGQSLGQCVQTVPENYVANHVGGRGAWPYFSPYFSKRWSRGSRFEWWRKDWPQFQTPRELAGGHLWDAYSCSSNSIGIEVVHRRVWTAECWSKLAQLLVDITDRTGIPLHPEHVMDHATAHPRARTSKRGDKWDCFETGQWSWDELERWL